MGPAATVGELGQWKAWVLLGQPVLLPTNALPTYKGEWQAGQGQCLGGKAMTLGLRSPQSGR